MRNKNETLRLALGKNPTVKQMVKVVKANPEWAAHKLTVPTPLVLTANNILTELEAGHPNWCQGGEDCSIQYDYGSIERWCTKEIGDVLLTKDTMNSESTFQVSICDWEIYRDPAGLETLMADLTAAQAFINEQENTRPDKVVV